MAKINRTYRMSGKTLDQIEWLMGRLNVTATDVIAIGVADLYERKRAEFTARLVEREPGTFDLLVGPAVVATFQSPAIQKLPLQVREGLLGQGLVGGGSLAAMLLAAAAAGEQAVVYPEAIAEVFVGEPGC
jgi:hypothetical protein